MKTLEPIITDQKMESSHVLSKTESDNITKYLYRPNMSNSQGAIVTIQKEMSSTCQLRFQQETDFLNKINDIIPIYQLQLRLFGLKSSSSILSNRQTFKHIADPSCSWTSCCLHKSSWLPWNLPYALILPEMHVICTTFTALLQAYHYLRQQL